MPATVRLQPPPSADELRARCDAVAPFTVGLEEEAMLLDPATLDLAPVAGDVLARLDGDPRFTRELPASQLEIATAPAASAAEALAQLAAARAALHDACAGLARPATAGVHPFAAPAGELSEGERYELIERAYGPVAQRQLVASLQVHVAVGGAERTLAVHDALRSFLPELAALAANGAFHDGRDSGLASVRPLISGTLPRQGVPPALESWERAAAELAWGARAGALAEPRLWWWELRPHPRYGTLELRVPDAQTTLAEAAGVVVVAQALVAWLAERWDAGERPPVVPRWRIEENRFAALRHGLEGELADLASGERIPAREQLRALLDELAPVAERLGAGALLPFAHALAERNGALRQRTVAAERGVHGLVAWMAERYGDAFPHVAASPSGAALGAPTAGVPWGA
ncbi:MAG: YbdK family carboxylate-amine ligase [Actinobacteria bacterium]|nr:YbdK family carboxylate-amine ligase [Actinomycetota bacterium]